MEIISSLLKLCILIITLIIIEPFNENDLLLSNTCYNILNQNTSAI